MTGVQTCALPIYGAVTREAVIEVLAEETAALAAEDPEALAAEAREIFERTALARELPAFFTGDAYDRYLVQSPAAV